MASTPNPVTEDIPPHVKRRQWVSPMLVALANADIPTSVFSKFMYPDKSDDYFDTIANGDAQPGDGDAVIAQMVTAFFEQSKHPRFVLAYMNREIVAKAARLKETFDIPSADDVFVRIDGTKRKTMTRKHVAQLVFGFSPGTLAPSKGTYPLSVENRCLLMAWLDTNPTLDNVKVVISEPLRRRGVSDEAIQTMLQTMADKGVHRLNCRRLLAGLPNGTINAAARALTPNGLIGSVPTPAVYEDIMAELQRLPDIEPKNVTVQIEAVQQEETTPVPTPADEVDPHMVGTQVMNDIDELKAKMAAVTVNGRTMADLRAVIAARLKFWHLAEQRLEKHAEELAAQVNCPICQFQLHHGALAKHLILEHADELVRRFLEQKE